MKELTSKTGGHQSSELLVEPLHAHSHVMEQFVMFDKSSCSTEQRARESPLTLLHSELPKLHRVLAVLSAIELKHPNMFDGSKRLIF